MSLKESASRGTRVCKRNLRISFSVVTLFLCSNALAGQVSTAPAPAMARTETTAKGDPLGRETPRSAVMGLLKYEQREDFATAARFLQEPSGQNLDLVQLVRRSRVLRHAFKGDIASLSDSPEGTLEPGLPPGQVRAGTLVIAGTSTDLILTRVDDPQFGKIWLVSQETVAKIPDLIAKIESQRPTTFDGVMPAVLSSHSFWGLSISQWLGWLISIPISMSLAWLLPFLFSAPRRLWYKLRNLPFRTVWEPRLGPPIKCIAVILIHSFLFYLLDPPLLYRVYYFRFMAGLLAACFAWLVSRMIDRGFEAAVQRTRHRGSGGEAILILMQRLHHILMIIITFVAALAIFGVNVTATLAGLGIGGLAIALGAQKTLDNIVSGVSLLMDKALQIGDFCDIGGKLGTVEDIGLRSIKLRTLDQNLLVVPNMALAQMQFENMKNRPKLLINQKFSLRIETPLKQLRSVLDGLQSMLDQHPSIEGSSRIRVDSVCGAAFELELFAYVKTSDWPQFTGIRQDIMLKIVELVEAVGTRFAPPTRLTYLSEDAATSEAKTKSIGAA